MPCCGLSSLPNGAGKTIVELRITTSVTVIAALIRKGIILIDTIKMQNSKKTSKLTGKYIQKMIGLFHGVEGMENYAQSLASSGDRRIQYRPRVKIMFMTPYCCFFHIFITRYDEHLDGGI